MKKPTPKRANRRQADALTEDEASRSRISGGSFPSSLPKKLKEKYGIPLAYISDPQWAKIQKLSGLPHSARFEINIALRRYWHHRMQAVEPETIERILSAREALDSAVDALIPLMTSEEELYKGRIVHFEQTAAEQHLQLERCLETVSRTEKLLSRIQDRLERSKKPGKPSYGPLYELIHHLDYVLYNFLNINVSRSPSRMSPLGTGSSLDLVTAILQIADLNVTDSTVDTIVKNYVRDRKRQGPESQAYPRA